MTSETSRLWVKVVVAITSPSYRALAGFGDGLGAAKRAEPVSARRRPSPPGAAPEAQEGRETLQVHAAV